MFKGPQKPPAGARKKKLQGPALLVSNIQPDQTYMFIIYSNSELVFFIKADGSGGESVLLKTPSSSDIQGEVELLVKHARI